MHAACFPHTYEEKSLIGASGAVNSEGTSTGSTGEGGIINHHKTTVSLQVDGRLLALLDREAAARGISRSEAARRGIERWASEAMEEDEERVSRQEARHRQLMNRIDYAIGMIRHQEKGERRGERQVRPGGEDGETSVIAEGQERPTVPQVDSEHEEQASANRLDEILGRSDGRRE